MWDVQVTKPHGWQSRTDTACGRKVAQVMAVAAARPFVAGLHLEHPLLAIY